MIRRSLRRFRLYLWKKWYVLKGGCDFCGGKDRLKFYDFGRACYQCYKVWLHGRNYGAGLRFMAEFYKKEPVK